MLDKILTLLLYKINVFGDNIILNFVKNNKKYVIKLLCKIKQ